MEADWISTPGKTGSADCVFTTDDLIDARQPRVVKALDPQLEYQQGRVAVGDAWVPHSLINLSIQLGRAIPAAEIVGIRMKRLCL